MPLAPCRRCLPALALCLPVFAQNGPGDLDLGFDPGEILAPGGPAMIHAMAVEGDGDVIVVGDFTSIGGVPRGRIARIKPDGTLDAGFASGAGADGPLAPLR